MIIQLTENLETSSSSVSSTELFLCSLHFPTTLHCFRRPVAPGYPLKDLHVKIKAPTKSPITPRQSGRRVTNIVMLISTC